MNKLLLNILKYFDPKQKAYKKKLMSFAFFLFISSVFWFLNALNERYTESITYPVAYTKLPKNKSQILKLPDKIELKVESTGYRILDYYLTANIDPLLVDFSKLTNNKPADCRYILTKDLVDKSRLAILSRFNIRDIKPDTIHFMFDNIIHKKVPIRINVDFDVEQGYVLKEQPKAFPDSISISGSKQLIEPVKEVNTGAFDLGVIKSSKKRNVALKKLNNIKFSTYRTNVLVDIEQATENIIDVPIQVISDNQFNTIKLVPNVVKLSYKTGLSRYQYIKSDYFKAVVDVNESNASVLPVRLEYDTTQVFDVEYTPRFVEFIQETDQ